LQHTHRYKRAPAGKEKDGKVYYFCTLPDCYHKMQREFLVGKKSLCNECGAELTLRLKEELRRAAPKCAKCSKTKEGARLRRAELLTKDLELDLGLNQSEELVEIEN
jgi:hypothetical protein